MSNQAADAAMMAARRDGGQLGLRKGAPRAPTNVRR